MLRCPTVIVDVHAHCTPIAFAEMAVRLAPARRGLSRIGEREIGIGAVAATSRLIGLVLRVLCAACTATAPAAPTAAPPPPTAAAPAPTAAPPAATAAPKPTVAPAAAPATAATGAQAQTPVSQRV